MTSRSIPHPTNVRSRRTRAALLSAAHAILEEEGFEGLTMTAVAEHAGVTRRALYMHFPGRGELVGALFDHVADVEGLAESLRGVWEAPDAVSALDEWAAHLARYHPRLLAVDRALQAVWHPTPPCTAGGSLQRNSRTAGASPAVSTRNAGSPPAGPPTPRATCSSRSSPRT